MTDDASDHRISVAGLWLIYGFNAALFMENSALRPFELQLSKAHLLIQSGQFFVPCQMFHILA